MRFISPLTKFVAVSLLLAASANLSQAIGIAVSVRGASQYGLDPGFASCSGSAIGDNCQSFNLTPTVVTFNGLNYNIFQVAINDGTNPVVIYDLLDVGAIGPNKTFSLPPLFTSTLTEVFGCGPQGVLDGSVVATDSSFPANNLAGPCTPGLTSIPDISFDPQTGLFSTGSTFSVYNLVLDIATSTPISTPEPASLVLLGVGMFAVGRKFRRAR